MYRTAELQKRSVGGVPLNTANAAVVAAVRLAYEVAEAQIERSTRLARRLREAGDKEVGGNSAHQAVDATERLVQKALLSGLEWWEGSVAEGRCPVKRLAAAEYQMLGTILGFTPAAQPDKSPPAPLRETKQRTGRPRAAASSPAGVREIQVVLKGDKKLRRHVRVEAWDLASTQGVDPELYFHRVDQDQEGSMQAELHLARDRISLVITRPEDARSGRWVCAVWNSDDVQVGYIEVTV